MTSAQSTFEEWEKTLPHSRMMYPTAVIDRVKYRFWRMYTPLHPFVRDVGLQLGIVTHTGRQNYLLGMRKTDRPLEDLVAYLISQGYGNHFIAWKDDGELMSLRKVDGFSHQYHIRIFDDGEVRAHYEYTPECYPILHFRAVDQIPRREEFLKLLDGWITTSSTEI